MSLTIKKTEYRFIITDEKDHPVKTYYTKVEPANLHGGHYKVKDFKSNSYIIFSQNTRFRIEIVTYQDVDLYLYCNKKDFTQLEVKELIEKIGQVGDIVYLSHAIDFFRRGQDAGCENLDRIKGELWVDGFLEQRY